MLVLAGVVVVVVVIVDSGFPDLDGDSFKDMKRQTPVDVRGSKNACIHVKVNKAASNPKVAVVVTSYHAFRSDDKAW